MTTETPFRVVTETLTSCGYQVYTKILNANQFGVPQRRERVFIVAVAGSLPTAFAFPVPPNTPTRVGDVLEEAVDGKYTYSDIMWEGILRHKARHEQKGNGFGYVLCDHDSPFTPTIPATYIRECVIAQLGKNPRKLTPREVARLQGFPDSYKIVVSERQAYHQFGNAVAVPVIRAIAKQIVALLKTAEASIEKPDLLTALFAA